MIPSNLTPEQVTEMVQDAYVYAYPLPVMYYTQQAQTTVPMDPATKTPSQVAPLNVFCNMTSFPDASFTAVVRANLDTLYSSAWLNLSTGPLVLKLPDTNSRYYLMPILSAWTDVIASPGMRTNLTTPSTAAQDFLLIGPGWKGPVPPCFDSLHVVRIPASMAWISGRTKAMNTPEDLATVHAVQAQYQLVPLADYLQDPTGDYHPDLAVPLNPSYSTDKPSEIVSQLSQDMAEPYFNLFARLSVHNPPLQGDGEMVDILEQLGIFPGEPVDWSGEPQQIRDAIAKGVQQGIQAIQDISGKTDVNGWTYSTSGIGNYQAPGAEHDNYLVRAQIALAGLGANLPQDAVYPASSASLNLDGKSTYTLQFTTGTPSPGVAKLPPVNPAAFWSITVYDGQGYLVPNTENKYSINSGDKLFYENGKLLTLYIQSAQPEDKLVPNWLPVAAGPFTLTMRLYWPDQSVLSSAWAPPKIQVAGVVQAVRKAETAA